jgi:hypothetical protein
MSNEVLPTPKNTPETPAEGEAQAPQLEFDDAYGYWMPPRSANTRHQNNDTTCGDANRREGENQGLNSNG